MRIASTFIVALLIIGAMLASCAETKISAPQQETPSYSENGTQTPSSELLIQIIENVTPQEAFALIQDNRDNPDFVIIDVRTPEEFASGHIEAAINLDYYSESFGDQLDQLDKSKTYLIYCRSGHRSANAVSMMAELNFQEVYNILGGIEQWRMEGLPLVTEEVEEKKSEPDSLKWQEEGIPKPLSHS